MAAAVRATLENSETLIVEAPTGVGKSLAYLVSGAFWAKAEGKVLLVSTHTRNLQDQILRRDLPLLRRLTDRRIDVAVLKGRANYLCRRRWEMARPEFLGTTDGEAFTRAFEGWAQRTESGDLDDAPALAPRLRALLSRVSSEARFCASNECAPDQGCYFKLSRRRARDAHLVLVNHALLVLEILGGGAGLPPYDGLVVDEAHHLPRVAADALARSVSSRSWISVLMGLGGQGEPGATDRIRRAIRGWHSRVDRARWVARIRELEADLGSLIDRSRAYFDALRSMEGFPATGGRARYRLGAGSGGPFPETTYPLLDAAGALLDAHRRFLDELSGPLGSGDAGRSLLSEISGAIEDLDVAVRDLTFLVEAGDPGAVFWFENEANDGATIRSRPIALSDSLGERLSGGRPLVLTSATLAVDGSTGFFARQCGLREGCRELVLPPVFDLERQVRVLVPRLMRDPRDAGHEVDLAQAIERLAREIPRKILVLFTSHETLRRVEEAIRGPLEDRGIHVYAQGRDASRQALAQAFQASERAVLLGAASFWEGVDFPGEELEILVMVRLPFPVPTDPYVEALAERLREEGGDGFEDFMLPEAIVRFRQGFGRLIRSRGDRGIFAILDPRILRRSYGERFTRALGIPVKAVVSWEDLVREGEAWFQSASEEGGREEMQK